MPHESTSNRRRQFIPRCYKKAQVHEALHISAQEESLLHVIRSEYERPIDAFSQNVLVAQLEVVLNYANRFYHRQFLTRRTAEHDLLTRFEAQVDAYFAREGQGEALRRRPERVDRLPRQHAAGSHRPDHPAAPAPRPHRKSQAPAAHHHAIHQRNRPLSRLRVPQYFSRLFKSKTGLPLAAFWFSAQ